MYIGICNDAMTERNICCDYYYCYQTTVAQKSTPGFDISLQEVAFLKEDSGKSIDDTTASPERHLMSDSVVLKAGGPDGAHEVVCSLAACHIWVPVSLRCILYMEHFIRRFTTIARIPFIICLFFQ